MGRSAWSAKTTTGSASKRLAVSTFPDTEQTHSQMTPDAGGLSRSASRLLIFLRGSPALPTNGIVTLRKIGLRAIRLMQGHVPRQPCGLLAHRLMQGHGPRQPCGLLAHRLMQGHGHRQPCGLLAHRLMLRQRNAVVPEEADGAATNKKVYAFSSRAGKPQRKKGRALGGGGSQAHASKSKPSPDGQRVRLRGWQGT